MWVEINMSERESNPGTSTIRDTVLYDEEPGSSLFASVVVYHDVYMKMHLHNFFRMCFSGKLVSTYIEQHVFNSIAWNVRSAFKIYPDRTLVATWSFVWDATNWVHIARNNFRSRCRSWSLVALTILHFQTDLGNLQREKKKHGKKL